MRHQVLESKWSSICSIQSRRLSQLTKYATTGSGQVDRICALPTSRGRQGALLFGLKKRFIAVAAHQTRLPWASGWFAHARVWAASWLYVEWMQ
jgi:hypothetical protein